MAIEYKDIASSELGESVEDRAAKFETMTGAWRLTNSLGDVFHMVDGKLHRLDGPAVVKKDGSQYFYLDGNLLPEDQWQTEVSKLSKNQNS